MDDWNLHGGLIPVKSAFVSAPADTEGTEKIMLDALDSLGFTGEFSVTRLGIAMPNAFATCAFTIFSVLVIDATDTIDYNLLASKVPRVLNNCFVLGMTRSRSDIVDLADLTELPPLPSGKLFGTGKVRMGSAISSLNRSDKSSTAGLYLQVENNTDVYCLSTAHGMGIAQGRKYPDSHGELLQRVMAPNNIDQQRYIDHLASTAQTWRMKIKQLELSVATTLDPSIRKREYALLAVLRIELRLAELQTRTAKGVTEDDRLFGDLICGQNGLIPGAMRLDWAVIKVCRELQRPVDITPQPVPKTPFLYDMTWKSFTGECGALLLDTPVRKTGQKTGTTYGIMGAKRAGRTSGGIEYAELLALSEAAVGFDPAENFAIDGDNGSAVLNPEGKAVGLVQGGYKLSDLQVLNTPAGIFDLSAFAGARQDTGTLRDAMSVGRELYLTRITPLDAVLRAVAAAVGVEGEKLSLVV